MRFTENVGLCPNPFAGHLYHVLPSPWGSLWVSLLSCSCFLVDNTGIEELLQNEKELVKIVDFMGRETEFKPNTPLIFIYSDGTVEKKMILE